MSDDTAPVRAREAQLAKALKRQAQGKSFLKGWLLRVYSATRSGGLRFPAPRS